MRLIDADKFANDEYLEKRYGTDFYWEFRKRLDMQPTVEELKKIKQEAYRKGYADGNHDGYCSTLIENGAEELYFDDENI